MEREIELIFELFCSEPTDLVKLHDFDHILVSLGMIVDRSELEAFALGKKELPKNAA